MKTVRTGTSSRSRLPFEGTTPAQWANLAAASLAIFWIVQLTLDVWWGNLCGHLGVDFCAFWSAGHVANTLGAAQIYDLRLLEVVERSLFPRFGDPATFAVSPFAYLPEFVLPFQALALLPLAPAFWIWTLLNSAALLWYLRFAAQRILGRPPGHRAFAMLCLSLPVYWNLLDGQVSVWLVICVGEFIRHWESRQPLRAGLWLGGLLLKPQLLIVIIPALLLRRSSRVLIGFALTLAAALLGAFLMVGAPGMAALVTVWVGFSEGISTNYVELMMNWRMLGLHVSALAGTLAGQTVVFIGMLLTCVSALCLWHRARIASPIEFRTLMLGTLAASGLVAWHSHIPAAMVMIPLLLVLYEEHQLPEAVLNAWVFIPATAYVLAFFVAAFVHAVARVPNSVISTSLALNAVRALSMFGLSIWILVWAGKKVYEIQATQGE